MPSRDIAGIVGDQAARGYVRRVSDVYEPETWYVNDEPSPESITACILRNIHTGRLVRTTPRCAHCGRLGLTDLTEVCPFCEPFLPEHSTIYYCDSIHRNEIRG